MTTLEKFRKADLRVTEIENKLPYNVENGDVVFIVTKEYDDALELAQNLYNELENQGINPF